MNHVKILRGTSTDQGTPGTLVWKRTRAGVLELPWLDNRREVSCVPSGTYKVLWTKSFALERSTYEIQGVPRRGGIRLHPGNFAGSIAAGFRSDSRGCPLPCRYFSTIGGQLAGLGSRAVVSQLELDLEQKPFELEIIWT